ncbi:endolytic transglycosylase MltG [Defluviitalea raffinosedens]|uniref:Endolytic murein transglycosylase n=1 Tax=Defluviitalea raffinosedens TaxID=1450156 RepID=A0A7C8LJ52_9FIRM|nr:endolytic transglycosylase MltG [Defluviitalea raffinosedens]KAE9637260.1 endolytic transglycosylase MltG [Defluviitalea raffinosedens]
MKKIVTHLTKGIINLCILLVMILACAFVGNLAFHYAYDIAHQPFPESRSIKEVEITIEQGATTKEIAKMLEEEGLVKNALWFELKSRYFKYDGKFKEGTFLLSTNMDEEEIMKILSSEGSKREGIKVTIPEGFTVEKIAQRLEDESIVKRDEFMEALKEINYDYDFLSMIPERNNRLEGYLFPDTYEVRKDSEASEIISKMLRRFDEIVKPEYYERAEELGYSMDQIITIASIIEQEAKLDEERPKIAGVIYNRLESNMNLQMCSTVMYALGKRKDRLLYSDLEVDSPYNTYLYNGLPIGPICNPGEASIKAALYPEKHDYYYFVLKDEETGEHEFTRTGEEHNLAKQKYNQKF